MAWLNIRAPARLHLGFIQGSDTAARTGSAAVAISEPELRLRMRKSDEVRVTGAYSDEFFSLAVEFLEEFVPDRGVEILVESSIKRHIGLGSGTRMALSVGMGISRLYDLSLNPYHIAEFFGRGRNSKAGLETLLEGGFAVSADGDSVSLTPPENWVFVVAIPDVKHDFFGEREIRAMEGLDHRADTKKDITGSLVNAIKDGDISAVGEALNMLDDVTGERFREVQNGKYTKSLMEKVLSHGKDMGAYGGGQSSWGPAVYFLTLSEKAEELKRRMRFFLDRNGGGIVYVSEISEKGISIDTEGENMHMEQRTGEENRILYKS